MGCYGFANRYPEPHGHGIPDHPADPLEGVVALRLHELGTLGERLQDRPFPQGNTSVLLWVAETAIAEAVELRRDRWRRPVPFHAAVNTSIGFAGFFFVAVGAKVSWPISPRP